MSKFESCAGDTRHASLEQTDLFWPGYSIRKSKRAKYLRINVCPANGVEIVIPPRTSLKQARLFLQQHIDWVRQQLEQYNVQTERQLPDSINLEAISKTWKVEYHLGRHQRYRAVDKHPLLFLHGPTMDFIHCRESLQQWLRRSARDALPEMLEQLGKKTGLNYNKAVIRSQKTRWGSCSSSGTINLNDRLMFLPRDTVEYVLLHELCHTRHMNHSARFWDLVSRHNPDYKHHENILKTASHHLPRWSY